MDQKLWGLPFGRNHLRLIHLFFADNSLLFQRAIVEGIQALKGVIQDYEVLSG